MNKSVPFNNIKRLTKSLLRNLNGMVWPGINNPIGMWFEAVSVELTHFLLYDFSGLGTSQTQNLYSNLILPGPEP